MPDALHVEQDPPNPLAKRAETAFLPSISRRKAAQGFEFDDRKRLGPRVSPRGGGLNAKPAVLCENRHDAGDGAHRVGEGRARVRVDGGRGTGGMALALLRAHLVAGTVDVSADERDELVTALDSFLEQEGAHDARACSDEVEREADEAEPVRRFGEGVAVGVAVRDGDHLRLDTCDERALGGAR